MGGGKEIIGVTVREHGSTDSDCYLCDMGQCGDTGSQHRRMVTSSPGPWGKVRARSDLARSIIKKHSSGLGMSQRDEI